MPDNIFTIIYVLGIVAAIAIRTPYSIQHRKNRAQRRQMNAAEGVAMTLWFIGAQLLPLLYLFTGWFDFADLPLAAVVGWVGMVVLVLSMVLLWRSHADLGRNWSAVVEIREGQTLITGGVYKRIRHPMYTAHFLWGIAQILLLHNWLVGLAGFVTFFPVYFARVGREEDAMLDEFGDEYRTYMQRTGRLLPRVG